LSDQVYEEVDVLPNFIGVLEDVFENELVFLFYFLKNGLDELLGKQLEMVDQNLN
jgi:hypothetical protein